MQSLQGVIAWRGDHHGRASSQRIRPQRQRFMARDYVTIREEQRHGQSVWTESSVGRSLLKSAPAKVTRRNGRHRIIGAAWGAPIKRVEVQIDSGPWLPAMIDGSEGAEYAWKIW